MLTFLITLVNAKEFNFRVLAALRIKPMSIRYTQTSPPDLKMKFKENIELKF